MYSKYKKHIFVISNFIDSIKTLSNKNTSKLLSFFLLFSFFNVPAYAAEPLKVAFIFINNVGDTGWSYQHNLGRLEMEKNLGTKIETKYVEGVKEGAGAERILQKLARSGYDLIFAPSFGFMNPTIKVAKEFPNVIFEQGTGYKTAENVATYLPRFYEGRYVTGIVAGGMTKSNCIGYVGAFPIPEVIRGINAFMLGAKTVNPEVTIKVIWANTWYDPGKEKEVADTLISQGCDVLTHHTDSPATHVAAEAADGVYTIGYHSDMSSFGPNVHLVSAVHEWGTYYTNVAKAVMDGTWKTRSVWHGFKEGMMNLSSFNDKVPQDLQDKALQAKEKIIDGSLHPFAGPIKDQSGAIKVEAGAIVDDQSLLNMTYFVEGVQGTIPK